MQSSLEVQMTVNMNINSSIINNWNCLPDTWLLIKGSEGAQAKPETSQLRAKGSVLEHRSLQGQRIFKMSD